MEGLQGADRLLAAAEATYADLQALPAAAGCGLARGVLAHCSNRLPDAIAHLARAQAHWANHDAATAAHGAKTGQGAKTAARGATAATAVAVPASSASEGDADRAECVRLLAVWTHDLITAEHATSKEKSAAQQGGLKRRTASTVVGAESETAAAPTGRAEAAAKLSPFWELVFFLGARYGRRAFAFLVFAMTAAAALFISPFF